MPTEDEYDRDPFDDEHFVSALLNLIDGGDIDGAFLVKFRATLDLDDRAAFDEYLAANYDRAVDHDLYVRRSFDYDLHVPCYDGTDYDDLPVLDLDAFHAAHDECRFNYHTPECDDYYARRDDYGRDSRS